MPDGALRRPCTCKVGRRLREELVRERACLRHAIHQQVQARDHVLFVTQQVLHRAAGGRVGKTVQEGGGRGGEGKATERADREGGQGRRRLRAAIEGED